MASNSFESLIPKMGTIEEGEQKQSKKSDQKKIGSENWIKFKTAAAMTMGGGRTKKREAGDHSEADKAEF